MSKKKKKKEKISGKSEVALNKLGGELDRIKSGVKKHGLVRDNPDPRLLESETNLSKCKNCILKDYKSDECIWLEDNKCSAKCKGFKSSIHGFGAVDINKVKHNILTNSDIQLQKKLRQYIPVAERIDKVLQEEEAALNRERQRKLIEQKIKELEELENNEDSFDIKPKRRNLTSLI